MTDPYRILVSEVMLQQTQTDRVEKKLPAFLKEFPSIRSLAMANKARVVRAWQGMGYNNRAIRLHELAKVVTTERSGTLPREKPELLALPGIGEYTASAMLCFAYRQRTAVVDVNVRRVLSRVFWRMRDATQVRSEYEISILAGKIAPSDAYTWNQALMDLGATVCKLRKPLCERCPVAELCASQRALARRAYDHSNLSENARVKKASEPHYKGIPRRIWRGRIVEALRNLSSQRSVSLNRLGRRVKTDFTESELPWLSGVVEALVRDGLVRKYDRQSAITVALADE